MRLDTTRILMDTLELLFSEQNEGSVNLIKSILTMTEETIHASPVQHTATVNVLMQYLRELVVDDIDPSDPGDRSNILMRLKYHSAFTESPTLYDQLVELARRERPMSERRMINARKRLRSHLIWWKMRDTISRMSNRCQVLGMTTDLESREILLKELVRGAYTVIETERATEDLTIPIEEVDMTNRESIERALRWNAEHNQEQRVLKTGFQGLNSMFEGGLRIGESVCGAALSHHYKTGMIQDLIRTITAYNDPPPTPPGYVPTALVISLEQEASKGALSWYERAYCQIMRHPPPSDMSLADIAQFVMDAFQTRGWTVVMKRRIGDDFTWDDFLSLQKEQKEQGRWVWITAIDYLLLMDYGSEEGLNESKQIQVLCRRFANFCRHTPQLGITMSQLDATADAVAASGVQSIVKRFSPSMLSECKQQQKEFDVFWFQHIETHQLTKRAWLTIRRYKHRDHAPSPHSVIAYPFDPELGILDDLEGDGRWVKDIYSTSLDENDDQGF